MLVSLTKLDNNMDLSELSITSLVAGTILKLMLTNVISQLEYIVKTGELFDYALVC